MTGVDPKLLAALAAESHQLGSMYGHLIEAGLALGGDTAEVDLCSQKLAEARTALSTEQVVTADTALRDAARALWAANAAKSRWWRFRRHAPFEIGYLLAVASLVLAFAFGWRPEWLSRAIPSQGHGLWGVPLAALGWGSLGSILRSLYWLHRQVARRIYRNHSAAAHLCSPAIGALFGAFIYLLLEAGLFVLEGRDAGVQNDALPFALAFLAGFNWETVLEWVKAFRVGASGGSAAGSAAPAAGAAKS